MMKMNNENTSYINGERSFGTKFASSVLLGSAAIISAGFVASLFLAPAMLPFGLAAVAAYSMWLKLAITATCSLVSVGSLMATIGLWTQRAESKADTAANTQNQIPSNENDIDADLSYSESKSV